MKKFINASIWQFYLLTLLVLAVTETLLHILIAQLHYSILPELFINIGLLSIVCAVLLYRNTGKLALVKEEAWLQTSALEAAANGIAITDRTGKFIWVNQAICEMTGYSKEEIIGKNPRVLRSGQQTPEFYKNLWETILAGRVWHNEIINRRKDGTTYVEEMTITPVKNSQNEIINFVAVKQDVSARKKAEASLRESEEKFRQVTENIKEVLWLSKPDMSEIYYVSPAYEEIWGSTRDELYDNPGSFMQAIHPEDHDLVMAELDKMRRDGYAGTEFRLLRLNGEVRWIRTRAFPIKDAKGVMYRVTGIAEDITDFKKVSEDLGEANLELMKTQRQLIQTEKMAAVGQLAAGVAHEIKNPLAIISLSTDELEKMMTQGDNQQRYFSMIKNATVRANKVIMELLNFSRTSEIELVPIEFHRALNNAVSLARNSAKLKYVELRMDLAENVPVIMADETLLAQAFLNLLNNAVDAIEKEGIIEIKTSLDRGGNIVLEIKDNGSGMTEDIRLKIFEPFFTTKERNKGTGLGLYIVYMICEKHNATIEVESAVNSGTKFKLVFSTIKKGALDEKDRCH